MTAHPVARLAGLTYRYPERREAALVAVDLTIDHGFTLVAGPSGSGKSSLLRVFNGLVPHFHGGTVSGDATVCGHDVITTPTQVLARHVGFVFQDPELQSVYPSVERDVAFGLENIGMPAALMRRRLDEALERTGIGHLRGRAVATLSGGERQRLALAGVLAMRPRLLVLDEPLSQLDDDGAASLVTTLEALAAEGTAVVVSEHRLDHLAEFAGRRLVMLAGRVAEGGGRPRRRGLAAFAGEALAFAHRVRHRSPGGSATFRRVPHAVPVVEGVSIDGRAGEVVALIGPNGGGKTTLLRTIAGLITPIHGHVERAAGRVRVPAAESDGAAPPFDGRRRGRVDGAR